MSRQCPFVDHVVRKGSERQLGAVDDRRLAEFHADAAAPEAGHATAALHAALAENIDTLLALAPDREFAREVAIHVAAAAPVYVSADEIPAEEIEAERKVFEAKAREEGKPSDVVSKVVEGQLSKWAKEVALLEQEHVRFGRYDGKTIEQIRAEIAASTGENIRIARFARFVVGEEQ